MPSISCRVSPRLTRPLLRALIVAGNGQRNHRRRCAQSGANLSLPIVSLFPGIFQGISAYSGRRRRWLSQKAAIFQHVTQEFPNLPSREFFEPSREIPDPNRDYVLPSTGKPLGCAPGIFLQQNAVAKWADSSPIDLFLGVAYHLQRRHDARHIRTSIDPLDDTVSGLTPWHPAHRREKLVTCLISFTSLFLFDLNRDRTRIEPDQHETY